MDLRERRDAGPRHPWEISRARAFRRVIERLRLPQPVAVLDAGAGDGWLARQLLPAFPAGSSVLCWDVEYSDDDVGADRGMAAGIRRARHLGDESFDVVLMLDLLEHVADDAAFLRDVIVPRLRRGGNVMVSVPAHPSLWSRHDIALGHHRRYGVRDIRDLLGHWWHVVAEGSLFTSLLVARYIERMLDRAGGRRAPVGVGAWSRGPRVTRAVTAALDVDNGINLVAARAGVRIPGLSNWAVATAAP